MIKEPLLKPFIESKDAWLCEPKKTRQMMTNWAYCRDNVDGHLQKRLCWRESVETCIPQSNCQWCGEETVGDDPKSRLKCDSGQAEIVFLRIGGLREKVDIIYFSLFFSAIMWNIVRHFCIIRTAAKIKEKKWFVLKDKLTYRHYINYCVSISIGVYVFTNMNTDSLGVFIFQQQRAKVNHFTICVCMYSCLYIVC